MEIDHTVINHCFEMWIEFGPTLGTPLEPRIKKRFPELTDKEIAHCVKECTAARDLGHKYVYDNGSMLIDATEKLHQDFSDRLKSKFKWLNEENLSRLFSQGCYYAMK